MSEQYSADYSYCIYTIYLTGAARQGHHLGVSVPAVAAMLQKYGVTLPFEYSRKCPDWADISYVHF